MNRTFVAGFALGALCAAVAACTTTVHTKRVLLAEALDAPDDRRMLFEATLRVLDAHPEYVDEMFQHVLDHEPTLDRFVLNTTRALKNETFAERTAAALVQHPESLYRVQIETLEASAGNEKAQEAIGRSINERAALATAAMMAYPPVIETMTAMLSEAVADKPEQRAAFLGAMRSQASTIAQILATHPPTLRSQVVALTELAKKRPAVASVLVPIITRGLDDATLAKATVEELVASPRILKKVVSRMYTAAEGHPLAQQALASTVAENPQAVATFMAARPESVTAATSALIDAAQKNDRVSAAMLKALRQRKAALAQLLVSDPETAAAMAAALGKVAVENSSYADDVRDWLRGRRTQEGRGGSGQPDEQ